MKITRGQLRRIIREESENILSESVTGEATRIGRELYNIPSIAQKKVHGDLSKLGEEVNRSQAKIFVDIFLSYMDQEIAKLDQRYKRVPGQEHYEADKAKARHEEILANPGDFMAEISEAIKPFVSLLGKYQAYIDLGVR